MAGGEENGKAVGRGGGGDEAGLPKSLQGKIYYWVNLESIGRTGGARQRVYIYGINCLCLLEYGQSLNCFTFQSSICYGTTLLI